MYEFGIVNNKTKERAIMWGLNWKDAFRRTNKNPDEWEIEYEEYVD
jgi:hypothetical protein